MKNKDGNSNLNKTDQIILGFIKNDLTLNEYIASRRELFGVPKGGFKKNEPLDGYDIDYNKLASSLIESIKVIGVCYKLSSRWGVVLLHYLLLDRVIPPDPPVTMSHTDSGLVIVIQDRANELRYLNQFLKSNGISEKPKELLKNVSASKDLTLYPLQLRIMQLKEEGFKSKEIADVLREEFSGANLPRELLAEFDERATASMSAVEYIDNVYSNLNRLLKDYKLKPEIHIHKMHMILKKMEKI